MPKGYKRNCYFSFLFSKWYNILHIKIIARGLIMIIVYLNHKYTRNKGEKKYNLYGVLFRTKETLLCWSIKTLHNSLIINSFEWSFKELHITYANDSRREIMIIVYHSHKYTKNKGKKNYSLYGVLFVQRKLYFVEA